MGWTLAFRLLALLACGNPDPDAKLRAGDLPGAAAAWEERTGAPLDVAHPIAEILGMRARGDATITTTTIADAMDAVRFLEQAPIIRMQALDIGFDRFEDFGAALDALAEGHALVVVGRSEGLGDKDPYLMGGALPWKGGRIVGWARKPASGGAASGASASGAPAGARAAVPIAPDVETLGKRIDADPPARLVVVGVRDGTGSVYLNLGHKEGAWVVLSTSDAEAAARLVLAAGAVRDYGGPALRARVGGGFVRR